jgi:DNA-binding Lrp family transcriptional regulator
MPERLDPIDLRLLEEFQRGFPLVPRPFEVLGRSLDLSETEVLDRVARLKDEGKIARVGATVRPNTAGASTLAAMSIEPWRIEEIAEIVGQEPGVNHSYQREHAWNLWFVATAADKEALQALLARIGQRTGHEVLDLPLLRAFNIDLGFSLHGPRHALGIGADPDMGALTEEDRPLLQALSSGMTITAEPFKTLGQAIGWPEPRVIARIAALARAGILTRVGIIVRHRALGWTSNAMVVFDLPQERITDAGHALAGLPGVTLCYQRRSLADVWPWGLFCMIHARNRPEALGLLETALALPELAGASHQVLFSMRCFKQTGAQLAREEESA